MKRLVTAKIFVLTLLLNGCATLERLETEQLSLLKQDLTVQPEKSVLKDQLADEYSGQYSKPVDRRTLDAEIEYHLKVLQTDPDNGDSNLAAYDLLGTRAIESANFSDVEALRKIYRQDVVNQDASLAPPSLIEALVHIRNPQRSFSTDKVAQLCRAAIRENKQHGTAYLILSRLHVDQNRLDMATEVLKQASRNTPGHADVLTELANVYMLRLDAQRCHGDVSLAEESVKFNQLALRSSPREPSLSENLAVIYRVMNQPQRALQYAKNRSELEGSLSAREGLAQGYMFAGRFDQARQVLVDILADNKHSASTWEQLGILYFTRSDWQKAFDAFTNARRYQQQTSVYNTLRYAISAHMIGRAGFSRSVLQQHLPSLDAGQFERALSDFYRQKKSADELIASARNFCDKTEAYYFLAMYALMKNNAEQAAGLFNKVLLIKDYSSTQYVGAKQILQVLAQ